MLEKVDLFQSLGRILAQDDDDVQAVRQQIKKAREIWARVGQVPSSTRLLCSLSSYMAARIWNLTTTALARLEGFHIHAAYRMAEKHKPKKGPHHKWVYPRSSNALQECGIATILHYINVRRATIYQCVVDWPISEACREGERRRGLTPLQWWWEQKMSLDNADADRANK